MNYQDWYTDRMDICRVRNVREGSLTVQRREAVAESVPCRIYRSGVHGPQTGPAAATAGGEDKLACGLEVDLQAGDELLIRRGAGLGTALRIVRGLAGEPVGFHEPFGAVMPGLAHQEVALLQREYIEGGMEDGDG